MEISKELRTLKFSEIRKRSLPTEELKKGFREEVAFELGLEAW